MAKRFLTIWFRHLTTDWLTLRQPSLAKLPFVTAAPDHGRMVVAASSPAAQAENIHPGMALADARALLPGLRVFDEQADLGVKLLTALGHWCIRFSPGVALDLPDGLTLDVTGCAHLWGGEGPYLKEILQRLRGSGYQARGALTESSAASWALAHFGTTSPLVEPGNLASVLYPLPVAALRLPAATLERLRTLGLYQVGQVAGLPRAALRRRFGQELLLRMDQVLGREEERLEWLIPPEAYQERLPCLEPIVTGTGIEIALRRLLEAICARLQREGKGLRKAVLKCYRVDHIVKEIGIGTTHPSHQVEHLFRLFEEKIPTLEPGLGIELFTLDASGVEEAPPLQESLWNPPPGTDDRELAQLVDRLESKLGAGTVRRYLPAEHHWPERSFQPAASLRDQPSLPWPQNRPRPPRLLTPPRPIEVTAPVPDYPPMLFRYQNVLHKIRLADGPERVETEWWIEEGEHRDYYNVEDEQGKRYWLFRAGHYAGDKPATWFLHGFFE